jgi:hypothetical protein
MQFLKPEDLTPEHFDALSEPRELSAAEKAEVMRLYMADITEADLQQYAEWEKAMPFEDVLRELAEEQQRDDGFSPA